MQPCWTCVNYCGKCPWTNGFHPIPGWDAVPSVKGRGKDALHSFDIRWCPMKKWDGTPEPEERGTPKPIGSLSSEEERLRMDLYQRGLTDTQMAQKIGLPVSTIAGWRKRRKLIANKENIKDTARMALYRKGLSDGDIGRILGVSNGVIREWRKKRKLKANVMGRPRKKDAI